MYRHWLRAVKTDKAVNPVGVCWMCRAGERGIPYEDFNKSAAWATTPNTPPWQVEPCMLKLFHCESDPAGTWRPDIWHCFHGGAGKTFIASCLTECLFLFDGSKDAKIEKVADELRLWASEKENQMPHSGQFCKERIGLTSYQVVPEASWSKFNDTYLYHKFAQWLLEKHRETCDQSWTLSRLLQALRAINFSFSTLYKSGLWLTSEEALEAGQSGRAWLAIYAHLSHASWLEKGVRFPVNVKHHVLDHVYRKLVNEAAVHQWILNPLSESVQLDEDLWREQMFAVGFRLLLPLDSFASRPDLRISSDTVRG